MINRVSPSSSAEAPRSRLNRLKDAQRRGGPARSRRLIVAAVSVICALLLSAAAIAALGGAAEVRAQSACSRVPIPFPPPATPTPTPTPPPPSPFSLVCYAPGWHLVTSPYGFSYPVPILVWDPGSGQYEQFPAGAQFGAAGASNGQGAWAYFTQSPFTNIGMPGIPNTAPPVTVQLQAGQWQLIGDPYALYGADICPSAAYVFTYDNATGTYSQTTNIDSGRGAWAYSPSGGTVTFASPPLSTCPSLGSAVAGG